MEYLKPETDYAKKLNHFVQYYLIAQEKDADLEEELVQKCLEILMNSPDIKEVQIAQICLGKLPLILNAAHLAFVQKLHHNWLDNFRAVKLVQLYYVKEKEFELLPALLETSQRQVLDIDKRLFYPFRNYCLLGFLQRDYKLWKYLLSQKMDVSDFSKLHRALALVNFLYFRDSRDLLDSLDLRDLQDLRDLWDLQGLRDWLQLEQKLEQECQEFIQSPKFPSYLSKLEEVKERFQSLTPEQKRQYFINVDE